MGPTLPTTDQPFELLGVAPNASLRELQRAYSQLIRQHRPDRSPREFARIHAAFEAARALLRQTHTTAPPYDATRPAFATAPPYDATGRKAELPPGPSSSWQRVQWEPAQSTDVPQMQPAWSQRVDAFLAADNWQPLLDEISTDAFRSAASQDASLIAPMWKVLTVAVWHDRPRVEHELSSLSAFVDSSHDFRALAQALQIEPLLRSGPPVPRLLLPWLRLGRSGPIAQRQLLAELCDGPKFQAPAFWLQLKALSPKHELVAFHVLETLEWMGLADGRISAELSREERSRLEAVIGAAVDATTGWKRVGRLALRCAQFTTLACLGLMPWWGIGRGLGVSVLVWLVCLAFIVVADLFAEPLAIEVVRRHAEQQRLHYPLLVELAYAMRPKYPLGYLLGHDSTLELYVSIWNAKHLYRAMAAGALS